MAIEYTLRGDAHADLDQLTSFFTEAIEGRLGPDKTVFRDGMYVTAYPVPDGEGHETTRLLGFQHRITAVYHFSNLADQATHDHNVAVMIRSVLAFFDRFGGHGALLFNGEEVTIQRLTNEIIFNSDWDDWTGVDALTSLIAPHSSRPLPQPLL
ncbi:SitI3 family protein [Actinoplanes sp. NPDC051861]|uniref:SitI3 family protein n=1 Tax=Actinoplanes sp. NPDC051861 TaxID=3155170 RepID=UPI00343396BA